MHNAGDEVGLALTGETIIGKDNYVTQSVGNELRISSATRSRLPGVSVTSGELVVHMASEAFDSSFDCSPGSLGAVY